MKPTLITLLVFVAGFRSAVAGQEGDFTYESDGAGITIVDYTGSGGEIEIPLMIAGLPVCRIGAYAFYGRSSLTGVVIPAGVASMGAWAFARCHGLTNIVVNQASACFSSLDGVLFDADRRRLVQCPGGRKGPFFVPSGVAAIADGAFAWCAGVTEVTIPDSVGDIGDDAFYSCTGLASAMIGNGVTNIGCSAFSSCVNLVDVSLGRGVAAIGDYAFHACYSLGSIVIPAGVAFLGDCAFSSCSGLQAIYFTGAPPAFGDTLFLGAGAVILCRLPGTSGWGGGYAGHPVLLWNPRMTAIAAPSPAVGFSCTVTGTPAIPVAVEACSDLRNGVWCRLLTATIPPGASLTFHDADSTKHPARFYRIVGP